MSQDKFKELYVRGELGEIRKASHDEVLTVARSMMNRKVRRGTSMSSPKLVKDFLTTKLGTLEHETFCVILLDLCGAAVYAETLHYSAALA